MARKWIIQGIVLLIVAGIITTAFFFLRQMYLSPDQTGQLILHGNVDIREVRLAFNGNDRIRTMTVQEGDRVRKGQLLASLDPSRLEAQVNSARSQMQAQEQVVASLEAGTRPEEIRKAEADLHAAKVRADNARLTLDRMKALVPTGAATQQDLDNASAAYQAAKAQEQSMQAALDLALAGPRQQDIAAAKATLEALRAQVALVEKQLEDAHLYAPADGVIRDRILEPGDMAAPSSPAYTLALTTPLWIRAYVSETDLGKVHPGQQAAITTDSFPGKQYKGWVGFISPMAEFTPKSVETEEVRTSLVYEVRVFVDDPNNELRLGMPAIVHLDLNQTDGAASQTQPGFQP